MMNNEITQETRATWQVPAFETRLWLGQAQPWCIVIPVINEGERIGKLLDRMTALGIHNLADILIVDGGSTDGSLNIAALQAQGVRGLLVKTGPGKLSAQLRCAYAFALDQGISVQSPLPLDRGRELGGISLNLKPSPPTPLPQAGEGSERLHQGYAGIVTIDGNNKDDPEAIPRFINALNDGMDFVQASRYLPGGIGENTPKLREFAIRWVHAPVLSLCSGFHWTDTTQGFRAYSRKMLLDPKVAPFRDIFSTYELLAYLSYRAPKLGYRCLELPTTRRYPATGQVPTKISSIKGNLSVLTILIKACLGQYNPEGQ